MTDLRVTKLRRLDLTTLLVFQGLMRLRKATAVGEELGLTSPGVSHALKRLRDVFGDELFLRRPHGLEPTDFAINLEPRVRRAIDELRDALSAPGMFDPNVAEAIVRISAFDYELSTIVPPLVGMIAREAPGIRIVAQADGRDVALAALADGKLDLAIGYFWDAPKSIHLTRLYAESYVVVARAEDPIARKPLTLARYCAASHVLVSPSGELSGIVDTALRKLGRTRRVISATPLFLPALAMVKETGALATVPRWLALRFAESFGLAVLKPPVAVREFNVSIARHIRNARNPMHDWLEGLLLKLTASNPA
jgi:DNA-binding transcriptional LysR family regulator